MTTSNAAIRIEHDLIGDREVPANTCRGVPTLRTVENFPMTGQTVAQASDLIDALAAVRWAAAAANRDLGLLDPILAGAIVAACRKIRQGALHDQFGVGLIQGAPAPRPT